MIMTQIVNSLLPSVKPYRSKSCFIFEPYQIVYIGQPWLFHPVMGIFTAAGIFSQDIIIGLETRSGRSY